MRLIFLIEYSSNAGGMLQSVSSLINGLSLNGHHEITLVSPKNSEISQIKYKGDVRVLCTKSDVWSFSRKHIINTIKTSLEIWKMTKKDAGNACFVTNNLGSSILLSLFPSFQVREIFISRGGTFKSNGLGGLFMRMKFRYGHISHVVTTSNRLKEIISKFGYPSNKIDVIYNGVPIPRKVSPSSGKINASPLRISSIGYYSDRKNHIEGIRLLKLLRGKGIDAYLYIYGTAGCESDVIYKSKLDEEISKLGLEKYVLFKGFVKGDVLYDETDVMISFAKEEGFGRTLPEAMLRKIPLIAFRGAGGPTDITQNGRYGYLVDQCDSQSYFSCLIKMLDNPKEVEKVVDDAYEYAMNVFTEEKMVDRYELFFNQVIF